MKISEFKKLIREEVQNVINEASKGPKFRDQKSQYLYNVVVAADQQNKLKKLPQAFEDYLIDLDVDWNLATTNKAKFMKDIADELNFADMSSVEWGEIKGIEKQLGLSTKSTSSTSSMPTVAKPNGGIILGTTKDGHEIYQNHKISFYEYPGTWINDIIVDKKGNNYIGKSGETYSFNNFNKMIDNGYKVKAGEKMGNLNYYKDLGVKK
jgi:hypothetical protein